MGKNGTGWEEKKEKGTELRKREKGDEIDGRGKRNSTRDEKLRE